MIGYSKKIQTSTPRKKRKTQYEINKESNQILDKIYQAKGLYNICEIKLAKDCIKRSKITSTGTLLKMTYAHKNKRQWYKSRGREILLHDFNQTLRACIPCHMKIEHNKELTEKYFKKLRNT